MFKQKKIFIKRIEEQLYIVTTLLNRETTKGMQANEDKVLRYGSRTKILVGFIHHANKMEYKPFKVKIVK